MATIPDHDSYIAAAPEAFRPVLHYIRELLRGALPDAEEMVAYGIPGFRIRGTVAASYAAFSKQIGLYFLAPAISDHAEAIAESGLTASKTGITFPPHRPAPDHLVTRLANASGEHVDDWGRLPGRAPFLLVAPGKACRGSIRQVFDNGDDLTGPPARRSRISDLVDWPAAEAPSARREVPDLARAAIRIALSRRSKSE
ncbi:DUF1801 domain-containing protein [Streptomyces sp. NPDC006288]|uniref:iron chaperone n=1 Tax=Streptomyces sp. NPDC006288 TaxID=3156743 RepID=UPI00339E1F23